MGECFGFNSSKHERGVEECFLESFENHRDATENVNEIEAKLCTF